MNFVFGSIRDSIPTFTIWWTWMHMHPRSDHNLQSNTVLLPVQPSRCGMLLHYGDENRGQLQITMSGLV